MLLLLLAKVGEVFILHLRLLQQTPIEELILKFIARLKFLGKILSSQTRNTRLHSKNKENLINLVMVKIQQMMITIIMKKMLDKKQETKTSFNFKEIKTLQLNGLNYQTAQELVEKCHLKKTLLTDIHQSMPHGLPANQKQHQAHEIKVCDNIFQNFKIPYLRLTHKTND